MIKRRVRLSIDLDLETETDAQWWERLNVLKAVAAAAAHGSNVSAVIVHTDAILRWDPTDKKVS
jgi:hypothetical protein